MTKVVDTGRVFCESSRVDSEGETDAMAKPGKLRGLKKSDSWRYESAKWRSHWTTGGYCKRRSAKYDCKGKCKVCVNESEYRND